MAEKIYKRTGIRRDNNLSDLSDTKQALNNLLDTLVDDATSTFISEDLDAIRNIFSYNLSDTGYRQIAGSRVQITNNSGVDIDFIPRITYQNRLDRFRLFSGEPRINGGNGLTAKYFNANQVFENTQQVFTGSPINTDNFWEGGNFYYSGKFTPESVNEKGGVEWTGYFIPTTTGSHTFYINTTALTSFEFETQGYTSGIGTYTEQIRIGFSSTFTATGTSGNNFITLTSASNTNYVGIGQSVTASGIPSNTVIDYYDRETGVITLSENLTGNVSGNVVFSKAIGQSTQSFWTSYALEAQRRYNIRARYYIPQSVDVIGVTRNIDFNILYPGRSGINDLRYNYLYSYDYDFSDSAKGEFPIFLDNSILASGGLVGGASTSIDYVKVKSTKKVDIKYQPKTSDAAITKATTTGTTTINTNIIPLDNTTGIEVGNYVFGSNIPEGTIVEKIVINTFVILNNTATASGSTTLTFIDHRGFVKRTVGSISGTTLTLSSGNTSNLRSNMVVIGSGVNQYTGITTTGSSSVVTVSPSQTVGAGTTLYFYQSRGLIDDALAAFCNLSETKCIVTTSPTSSGATVLDVSNGYAGGINNWDVYGAQFASGTQVTSSTSTSITINTPTIAGLASGGNFTVTNVSVASSERSLCCPPTDTSPPFSATESGLETTVTYPDLKLDGGNVIFDALIATVTPANITNISTSDTSNKRIPIQTPSGTFNILCA
jgi:hypothetical protein